MFPGRSSIRRGQSHPQITQIDADLEVASCLLSFRAERSGAEESRDEIFKVAPRDPSTSLGMTANIAERSLTERHLSLVRPAREWGGPK